MTANELAAQFIEKGLSNQYISQGRGDFLFDLAHKSGQTEVAGSRSARGEANGKKWLLYRDMNPARWFFKVE